MTHHARSRTHRRESARRIRARLAAGAFALLGVLVAPGLVAAHPLGNFTINHYAGIRVEPERILLDVVIDHAEIPTFQARLDFDRDGDGELSSIETDAGRLAACGTLSKSLDLRVDDRPLSLRLSEAGLAFPPGAGGLSTMRSVCGFVADLEAPLEAGAAITFADRSSAERIGWREIVVAGSGVTVTGTGEGAIRTTSPSDRLTAYPEDLLTQALADTEVALLVNPGGPILPALDIPDAYPTVPDEAPGIATEPAASTGPGGAGATVDARNPISAAVPGGVGAGDLPSIFRTADLTPLVLLVSVLTAAALGAGHALTPGHGKTLMAAYLVGTRGTPIHAAGLGLSVALSHTLGIMVLAALVVGAQGILPADVVVRTAPLVAAVSIVLIGGWMLLGEARRRWRRGDTLSPAHGHGHDEAPLDPGAHEHGHGAHARTGHEHTRGHDGDEHEHEHRHGHRHDRGHEPASEHSHGGRRHRHLPTADSAISWRSLFVLGLAGGLIPSASALLILLGSIAAGRPAFGFVLVVAFGLGMAAVMSAIGLALVVARGRLDRADTSSLVGRATAHLPLLASCLVLGFGVYLTIQAISGNTVL